MKPAAEEIRSVIAAATRVDGVRPASDQAMLNLENSSPPTHLTVRADDHTLAGYAQVDGDGSAELVVHPDHRRRGHGRALVADVFAADPQARVWAHGDLPGAKALAASAGLTRLRSLWQMSRPLANRLPAFAPPADITIRTFIPGDDDAAWIIANAAAFADHREQGRLTEKDLRQRMAEPWFDPAGFFIAERDGEMIGYHWTKVVDQVGEVYVVGVTPQAQGSGLGRILTLVGLHHLRNLGLETVVLYTEEDNRRAVGLYTSLGFTRSAVDVQYGRSS